MEAFKSSIVGALVLGISLSAGADQKTFYAQRQALQALEASTQLRADSPFSLFGADPFFQRPLKIAQAGIFEQKIDHAAAASGDAPTFKQRYWVDTEFSSGADAPVFYYICGEGPCSDGYFMGAISRYAQQYHGTMVTLEHRYYGKSVPTPTLSTDNLKYLSTDFALQDLAAFEKFAVQNMGLKGKWIVVGGSYSGSLSAYYRSRYPELVAGSLSSSGPVQARDNFEDYDRHVTEVAGPECAARMREVVALAEAALPDPARLAEIKSQFAADKVVDPVDFLYLIADVGASAVQYGYRDPFCNSLATRDPLAAYADFAKQIYAMWGVDAVGFSVEGGLSENPGDYLNGFGARSWFYQSCTEYGYWQNAYHDPALSVRSARINPEYHRGLCRRLFGIDQPVDIARINTSLYQPLLDPAHASHILFTNGAEDPWSKLSISAENGNATNAQNRYLTIAGAAHCDDLGGKTSAAIEEARSLFSSLLSAWLQ